MKNILLFLIKIYQKTLSLDHGYLGKIFPNTRYCRFIPSCSQYGYEAIEKYGSIKGTYMLTKRLLKCNQWNKSNRYDPVK